MNMQNIESGIAEIKGRLEAEGQLSGEAKAAILEAIANAKAALTAVDAAIVEHFDSRDKVIAEITGVSTLPKE